MDAEQLSFATIFYWAAHIGGDTGKKLVDLFIKDLGFSPFLGVYRSQCPVAGAILGG
jgi:hypothetical protein